MLWQVEFARLYSLFDFSRDQEIIEILSHKREEYVGKRSNLDVGPLHLIDEIKAAPPRLKIPRLAIPFFVVFMVPLWFAYEFYAFSCNVFLRAIDRIKLLKKG